MKRRNASAELNLMKRNREEFIELPNPNKRLARCVIVHIHPSNKQQHIASLIDFLENDEDG